MFHTLSLPNLRFSAVLPRVHFGQVAPLTLAGAALAAAVLVNAPREASVPAVSAAQPIATLVEAAGGSTAALQMAAESLRAELLAVPGVGAVEARGLQTAGVEVRYTPSRLAEAGVRGADLLASLSAKEAAPGVIAVSPDMAQAGVGTVADMPVRAGRRVVRLGDVALVARTPLAAPLVRLRHDGQPAVELLVTPALGSAGAALDRQVATTLASTSIPAGVEMK